MKVVRHWLDDLAAGRVTLTEVAADFATRRWPERHETTDEQRWGAVDDFPADPNSWDAVNADSRLTAVQYQVLVEARNKARH